MPREGFLPAGGDRLELLQALEAERRLVVLPPAHANGVPGMKLSLENRLGERVLHPPLDDPAERPRAEDRVVALQGEEVEHVRVHDDLQLPFLNSSFTICRSSSRPRGSKTRISSIRLISSGRKWPRSAWRRRGRRTSED